MTWRPDDRQRMTAEYRAALARLPDAYTLALQCTDAGMSEEEICNQLGIEPESLEPLLELAYRKLHAELTRR